MNQVIRWTFALIAGVATFLVAGFVARFALQHLLMFLADGDAEFKKSLLSSPIIWIGAAIVAMVLVPSAIQKAMGLINKYGVPGVVPAVDAVVGEGKSVLVVLRANGVDDKGNPARLELFTTRIKATSLAEFVHGPAGSKLVALNDEGLFVVLYKARSSPYADESDREDTYSIALRSQQEIFYRFETLWGETGRFVEKPESKVATCRYSLEFVGCDRTEANASLLFQGDKPTMREIFLAPARVQKHDEKPESEAGRENPPPASDAQSQAQPPNY